MSEAAATFSWQIGTLCGLIFAMTLVLAIAATPRLREHDGRLGRAQLSHGTAIFERWLIRISPLLCAGIWIAGAWSVGSVQLSYYVAYSAPAATVVLALVVLPIIATAASHIARRSVW